MKTQIAFVLAFVSIFFACKEPEKSPVIASFGQRELTVAELEWNIQQLKPVQQTELKDSILLRKFVTEWMITAAKAQEAEVKLAAAYPELKNKVDVQLKRDLARYFHFRFINENLGKTDAELKEYFEGHAKEFSGQKGFEESRVDIAEKMLFPEQTIDSIYQADSLKYKGPRGDQNTAKKRIVSELKSKVYQTLTEDLMKGLEKQYGIARESMKEMDVQKFYESRKEQFKTQKKILVYQIKSKDSTAVQKAYDSISDKSSFIEFAQKVNTKEYLRASEGRLGWVKFQHSVPYQGPLSEMNALIDSLTQRGKTQIIPFVKDRSFNLFWVDSIVLPEQKPFARVKKDLEAQFAMGSIELPIDSSAVIVTSHGKPFLLGADLIAFYQEIPPNRRAQIPKEKLVDVLLTWELFFQEIKRLKYDEYPLFKFKKNKTSEKLWAEIWEQNSDKLFYGVSEKDMGAFYAKYAPSFPDESFEDVKKDLALAMKISQSGYRMAFLNNIEKFGGVDSPDSLDKYRIEVFKLAKFTEQKAVKMRREKELLESGKVKMKNLISTPYQSVPAVLKEASPLWHRLENPPDSLKYWPNNERVRMLKEVKDLIKPVYELNPDAPRADTLTYIMGQLQYDLKNYRDASWYFDRYTLLYPERADRDKALFLKGFIYSEQMKQDSLALIAFDEIVKKYPQSDFFDDADFMARDLRSGRALSKAFMEKLQKGDLPTSSEEIEQESK